ncbi:MAG TPA: Hsp33 family molecular chaperone HslO [Burkholderiales bacterium]
MDNNVVQRFLFEDLDIRGRLVVLQGAWREMLAGRRYSPDVVGLLGHTTALAVLLGAHRKDTARLTLQVQGSGPVRLLVADCDPELRIRGMAQVDPDAPEGSARALLGDGRLALTLEDARSGQLYQSLVPLEGEMMAEIFAHYLAQSEQRDAALQLHADTQSLSGLMLEKLPGADARDPDGWARITQLAATLRPGEASTLSPQDLLTRLFPDELLRVYPQDEVRYHCPYDPSKVEDMLRSLGRAEVDGILAEHGEVVIRNEICNHVYRFDGDAVAALFARPAAPGR